MLSYLSLSVTPLRTFYEEGLLGSATGFFYAAGQEVWLITNWHVLSGRDPRTGQARSSMGAVPNHLQFFSSYAIDETSGHYDWNSETVPLDEGAGQAIWFQHPTKGQAIDVAAINLGARADLMALAINRQKDHQPQISSNIGEELYILGYPLGIEPLGHFPIWKRASLATYPTANAFGKPAFLMDTATREGMSGAPVIFPEKQLYQMNHGGIRIGDSRYKLAGVYSGRFEGRDELGASLAIGWHAQVIDEIVSGRAAGTFMIRTTDEPF